MMPWRLNYRKIFTCFHGGRRRKKSSLKFLSTVGVNKFTCRHGLISSSISTNLILSVHTIKYPRKSFQIDPT
uniref:Uncharacterized protein n=1 Tax=Arundo donax TaxID=35708 RepID=A0A0A9HSC3_ARUDO